MAVLEPHEAQLDLSPHHADFLVAPRPTAGEVRLHNGEDLDHVFPNGDVRGIESSPGYSAPRLEPTWYATKGKRLFDIIVGSILLLLMLPLLAAAGVVVLLSLGRPLFFQQLRVGGGGRPFLIFKYRTMKAEPIIDLSSGSQMGLVVEVEERTTVSTRLLRALSLDELPQIFNVLLGSMSLVGPRPEVWGIAAESGLIDHPRTLVKPGMTGLWQISPERRGEIVDGVALDFEYISRLSLRQDLAILLRTPLAVLRSDTD